jgi:hypothetical protein
MTIDSFNRDQNTGQFNTGACNNYILGGPEPINWAYITRSGVSQAPADPLFTGTFDSPNFAAVNPDFNRDLMMSPVTASGSICTTHRRGSEPTCST